MRVFKDMPSGWVASGTNENNQDCYFDYLFSISRSHMNLVYTNLPYLQNLLIGTQHK